MKGPFPKQTKKAKLEFLRHMLKTNIDWAKRGLLRVYENQTADERRQHLTVEENGVGFTSYHAATLTALSIHIKNGPALRAEHRQVILKYTHHYTNQIFNLCDQVKLEAAMRRRAL